MTARVSKIVPKREPIPEVNIKLWNSDRKQAILASAIGALWNRILAVDVVVFVDREEHFKMVESNFELVRDWNVVDDVEWLIGTPIVDELGHELFDRPDEEQGALADVDFEGPDLVTIEKRWG